MSARIDGLVVCAVAVAGALLSLPSTGRCAAGDTRPAPVAARSVEISFVGSDRARARLEGAVAPLVRGDSRISWLRSPPAESDRPQPGVFRVRVDAPGDGVVRIVALIPERPPAARAIEARELDPVTTEVVAQIVGATARAMLAGETVFATADAHPPATGPAPFVPPAGSGAAAPRDAAPVVAAVPAPTRAREVAVSLGYLARAIYFRSPTADAPLAHGAVLRASVFPATPWRRVRVFTAVSLEYFEVHLTDRSSPPFEIEHVEYAYGGYAHLGLAGRPQRFLEIGAGLGAGVMYAPAGSGAWVPAGRGQVSVAAVGLPTGMEVTAALTAEAVYLTYPSAGDGPISLYPLMNWFQPGMLLTLGWRL